MRALAQRRCSRTPRSSPRRRRRGAVGAVVQRSTRLHTPVWHACQWYWQNAQSAWGLYNLSIHPSIDYPHIFLLWILTKSDNALPTNQRISNVILTLNVSRFFETIRQGVLYVSIVESVKLLASLIQWQSNLLFQHVAIGHILWHWAISNCLLLRLGLEWFVYCISRKNTTNCITYTYCNVTS